MGVDVSKAAALERSKKLQERQWQAAAPNMDIARHGEAKRLHRAIRTYLINASDQHLIRESEKAIYELFLMIKCKGNDFDLAVGDVRNFNRNPALPHFTRSSDGAWFDFQLLAHEVSGTVEIKAYDFEIRFLTSKPEFIRYDLNLANHKNATIALRSHMHPGNDDEGLAVPAPIMTPFEILDLFLHGVSPLNVTQRTGRSADANLVSSASK